MKTSTKALEQSMVELSVSLDAEEMKAIVHKVENAYLRKATLPGFRPGKVPLALIRRHFADGLASETARTLVNEKLPEALQEAKVDCFSVVEIKDLKAEAEGGSFVALCEVRPSFELPKYKGLKISSQEVKVEASDVEEQIVRLRTAYATYEDAKEGEIIAEGDFVQIDYAGQAADGRALLELAPEAKVVASGTGFWFQVEAGRFLPEILEAVKGMKLGETKAGVKAKFDAQSAPEGLKGVEATYTVTVKAFRRRMLPNDAELVEKAKVKSMEELTTTIRESMEKQAVRQEAVRRENEAIEKLLEQVDFAVPASQLKRATEAYLNNLSERMRYAGISEEYAKENGDKILEDAKTHALKQVRLFYVISAIAKAEKLEGKDDEIGQKALDLVLANAEK